MTFIKVEALRNVVNHSSVSLLYIFLVRLTHAPVSKTFLRTQCFTSTWHNAMALCPSIASYSSAEKDEQIELFSAQGLPSAYPTGGVWS